MQALSQTWPVRCLGFRSEAKVETQRDLDLRVAKEAARSIASTAGAIAMNMALAQYVVLPVGITIFSWLATGALFYSAATAIDYGMRRLSGSMIQPNDGALETAKGAAILSAVHLIGQAGPHAFVHEAGHVIASKLLIQGSQPRLDIRAFGKSTTTFFNTREWTSLGSMLGPQSSFAVIAVAGVVSSVALCLLLSTVAHFVRKKNPQIAQIIELWGVSQLVTDVVYGLLTVLAADRVGGADNDFLMLQSVTGISPLCVVSSMVFIPVIYRLAVAAIERGQERERARVAAERSFSIWRPTRWRHHNAAA